MVPRGSKYAAWMLRDLDFAVLGSTPMSDYRVTGLIADAP